MQTAITLNCFYFFEEFENIPVKIVSCGSCTLYHNGILGESFKLKF